MAGARKLNVRRTLLVAAVVLAMLVWLLAPSSDRNSQYPAATDSYPESSLLNVDWTSSGFGVGADPSNLTLAHFETAILAKKELLSQTEAQDISTLGKRIRAYVKLHMMLLALHDQTRRRSLASCASEGSGCLSKDPNTESAYARLVLDDFSHLVAALERSLFQFFGGNISTPLHLYSLFAREPRTRGIVISAGNGHVRLAMVAIRSVRAAGCTLPIEVMHAGPSDLVQEFRDKIMSLGDGYDIVTKDVYQFIDNSAAGIGGWAVKPFAIMYSSFAEVLFQDADVLWLGSPNEVFEDPVYKSTGTLFYMDRRTLFGVGEETYNFAVSVLPETMRNPVPEALKSQNAMLAGKSSHQQESGVVAVDKSRISNIYGLLTTCKLNTAETRDKAVYNRVFGDKETFWLGWEMAGMSAMDGMYGWTPWPMIQIGYILRGDQDAEWVIKEANWGVPYQGHENDKDIRRICSLQLGHLDATGTRPLWFNGGPLRDKFLGAASPVTTPTHWAVEHHSRWDLFTDNIACLYLKPDTGPDVSNDGTVTERPNIAIEFELDHGDGHSVGRTKMSYVDKADGGFGGALAHKLKPKELKLFDTLKIWWEETNR
ncbi:glycosyltransferase family 71 protein [Gonapodya prolifera JEL478]|uniref:Glycosyltransferase family 71 protein n=1 Tax=Gonapodya prolifera (strain JEL478) TaxID=1344416 RepID=A0A139ART5_GONPJ|nr:glycosyltransferase family 71 protein [Gonapodya prolifera JEL478]|eukprot:KXS19253.1 glycosyltransferase family 71 protein [Gonapodya prolifera JEL478]